MPELTVLNKSVPLPAEPPEWIQLCPYGDFPGVCTDGTKVVQRLTAENAAALAAAFDQDALIDFEHWSSRRDGDTSAAAWMKRLEAREDGLYALMDWSGKGRKAIADKVYRFFSPCFSLREAGETGGLPLVEPVAVFGGALTNRPQIKAIRPIVNKETTSGNNPDNPNGGRRMKEVAKLLGLDGNAEESAFVEAVKSVLNRAQAAEDRAKLIENRALEAEATQFVADRAAQISDPEKVKAQYIENKDATIALFGSLKQPAEKPAPKSIHNREQTAAPAGDGFDKADDRSAEQRNAVKKYQIENKCSFQQAWDMVRSERPELFATEG